MHLSQQGYDSEADIADMYIVNMGEKEVLYTAIMTFQDELKVDCFYRYEKGTKEIV
ncbi:MAG: hypothetical protein WAM07_04340 [Halobacillus sp.]|uniref:hypothetical protein n=1 Tax=Halobacillus sp. TaxID=56800 RepID=UPI003BB10557